MAQNVVVRGGLITVNSIKIIGPTITSVSQLIVLVAGDYE